MAAAYPAVVRIMEFQGETTVLALNLSDTRAAELKAVVAATEHYSKGESVWLSLSPEIIHTVQRGNPCSQATG
jgi:ABC-type sugar transport system ATPase subunit